MHLIFKTQKQALITEFLLLHPKILYRTRYLSRLKSVASFRHMPSGSRETQLLAPVLHTTQSKHALLDLGGVCIPQTFLTPYMLGHPHMFGCSLYVWTPPHLDVPACMFGFPTCLDTTHMFGHPLYVWTSPICSDVPKPMGISKHMGASKTYRGNVQIYGEHPNIQAGASKYMGVSKHTGGVQTYRGIQTYWGCPNVWGDKDTP